MLELQILLRVKDDPVIYLRRVGIYILNTPLKRISLFFFILKILECTGRSKV